MEFKEVKDLREFKEVKEALSGISLISLNHNPVRCKPNFLSEGVRLGLDMKSARMGHT